jgi:hypothetical protein
LNPCYSKREDKEEGAKEENKDGGEMKIFSKIMLRYLDIHWQKVNLDKYLTQSLKIYQK